MATCFCWSSASLLWPWLSGRSCCTAWWFPHTRSGPSADMPRVSVIMNVRNGGAFLREALDSVLAQSFADWELIVWDDRSTDASAQIVAGYTDPRIRYHLSPEETPLGAARDLAMRHA